MVDVIVGVRGQVNSRDYNMSAHDKVFQRMKYELTDRMIEAVKEANDLLSDGQWHRTGEVYSIAEKHGVQRGNMLYQLPLAVSDCTRFFCIPDERTPLESPKPVYYGTKRHKKINKEVDK